MAREIKKFNLNTEKYYNAKTTYSVRFYSLLLKIEYLICSNEFKDIFAMIPKQISKEPEIVEFQMAYNVRTGTVSSDDVLNFSIKNNRYGIIVEYCIYLNNDGKIIEFINKALPLLEKDFSVFIIYVDAISKVKGQNEALSLLKRYETNYSIYPAFWIRAYFNSEIDDDQQWAVNSITNKIESKTISYDEINSFFTLIQILFKERKLETALQLINVIEYSWGFENDTDVICMKIDVLMSLERHIEALDEINKHHSILTENNRILDLFLCISLNNNRSIPEDIISCAKKCDDARILLLVAEVERNNKNIETAKIYAMKSLLNIAHSIKLWR